MRKKLAGLSTFAYLSFFALVSRAHAQASIDLPTIPGFSSQDVKVTIMNLIQIVIGFLGIIMIIIILFGGFKMMASRGDADEMGKGRQIIAAGVVGLVIVLAAYSIAIFVINSLTQAM